MNIINAGGGVVDCYIADSGKDKNKIRAQMTVNTNYLILGDAPTRRGDPAQREALPRSSARPTSSACRRCNSPISSNASAGRTCRPWSATVDGANSNDFRAKPEEGVLRKSTGNTSDVFKEREPPAPVRVAITGSRRRRNRHASRLFRHRCHRRSASPRTQPLTRQRYRPTVA